MSRSVLREAATGSAVSQRVLSWKEELRRPYLWLVLAMGLVVFLPGLDATRLWDEDEGFFASAAAEMYARGDWVVPYFNGQMFGHKPAWMYWMMMAGFGLFGVGELGARCFSAVFAIASVLLTYRFGSVVFNRRAGLFAALALGTSLMFTVVGRAATPDCFLTFFATLSLYIFAVHGFAATRRESIENSTGRTTDTDSPEVQAQNASECVGWTHLLAPRACMFDSAARLGEPKRLPARWMPFAVMYAVMGLGALTKGPIGFLFPMAVIGLFLLCTTARRVLPSDAPAWQRWREALRPFGPVNFVRTVWLMRPLTCILVILAVAGPWYYAVGVQTEGAFLQEFFGVHHFHRAATSMESHSGSIVYYPLSIIIGMFPWTVFLTPAGILWVRAMRSGRHRFALILISCWAGVYLGIFSLAATKLPNYVLPAYPAFALFFGFGLDGWLSAPDSVAVRWRRGAFGTIAFVGLGMIAVFPIIALVEFGGQTLLDRAGLVKAVQHEMAWLGLIGVPAAVGGLAAIVLAERRRLGAAVAAVCVTAVATVVVLWNGAAPWVDQFQASQEIVQRLHRDHRVAGEDVGTFGFFRPSMVFYNGRPVRRYTQPEEVLEFFATNPAGFLITESSKMAELEPFLPPDVTVILRRPRFPEKGELTLLARRPEATVADKPAVIR